MKRCLILILFFLSQIASAKNVWIDVVGLSEKHIEDNYISFYQSADSFLKMCKTSQLKPDCKLFLNQSIPVVGSNAKVVSQFHFPETENSNKKNILDYLSRALIQAGSGDTVLFNLTSHGAPVVDQGNSCSFINATERICETDLKEIIKLKNKGTKLFINAEGCFSGAFADLSSSEVCVATRVDRRSGALSSEGFIWDLLSKKKITQLNDFGSILGDRYSQIPILASVQMKNLMCRDFRMKNYKNWPQQTSFFVENEDEKNYFEKINKNTDFYTKDFTNEIAEDILTNYPMFLKNKILGFIEFRKEAKNFDCKPIFNKKFCESYHTFFSSHVDAKIERLLAIAQKIEVAKKPEQLNLLKQFKLEFNQLYSGQVLESWNEIEPCFFNMEADITQEEIEYFNDHKFQGELFPRAFNQKDIDEAKSCESQIKFDVK